MSRPRLEPARRRELRHVQRMRTGLPVVKLAHRRHGSRATYNDGCKCDECTDAETDYQFVQKIGRRR